MLQLYLLFVWGEDKCINIHRLKLQYQLKPISIKKKSCQIILKSIFNYDSEMWVENLTWCNWQFLSTAVFSFGIINQINKQPSFKFLN